jgi:hypothetical protein
MKALSLACQQQATSTDRGKGNFQVEGMGKDHRVYRKLRHRVSQDDIAEV